MNKITILVPLSEFVSKIDKICPRETDQMYDLWKLHQLGLITRYNKFLFQPLELGFFVSVGEDGNVLEAPPLNPPMLSNTYYDDCIKYNNAKSKILFEEFTSPDNFKTHKSKDYDYWVIKFPYSNYSQTHTHEQYEKELVGTHVVIGGKIEYIAHFGLNLTEQALKQIYG